VPVRPERRAEIPAVTHVDGTSRIQAVHREHSPHYHAVISKFCEVTGVPVVLNTSFNLRGEPIVNTPAEAFSTFARSDMDALVMGRFLVSRRAAGEGRLVPGAELEKWAHAPQRASGTEGRPEAPAAPPPAAGPGVFGVRPEEAPAPRRTRFWERVGSLAAGLVASFLVLEFLVRFWLPNPNMQVRGMYAEDETGLHLRPGWQGRVHTAEFDVPVTIDPEGRRAVPPPAVTSGRTLLALGDSFTFGCWSPAEKTWLAGLGRATGAQVVNAGSPNAGTDTAAAWLAGPGASVPADLAVLAFYSGNDFFDNLAGRKAFTLDAGFLVLRPAAEARWSGYDCLARVPQPAPGGPFPDRRPWYRSLLGRSHLYQFGRSLMYGASRQALRPNMAQAWFLRQYTSEMEQALQNTTNHLDEVLAQARRRGMPLALVVIPSAQEVYDEDWRAWLDYQGLDEQLFDRNRPRRFVMAWARDRGVPALDLVPVLRGRERLYYRADMHWSDLGHFQVGEKVAEFLRQQNLLNPGTVKEEEP